MFHCLETVETKADLWITTSVRPSQCLLSLMFRFSSHIQHKAHEKMANYSPRAGSRPRGTSSHLKGLFLPYRPRNSLHSAPGTRVRPSSPGEALAPTPAVKKPVPKIDLTLHRCRKATKYLKSSQLECDACSFQAAFSHISKPLYMKTM